MEKEKKLIEEIRESCRQIRRKVEALDSEKINLSIAVGSNNKTVEFNDVSVFEINIKASVSQEL